MQLQKEQPSSTSFRLQFSASSKELSSAKEAALAKLGGGVKVPGFRPGKAPLAMLEKHVDQNLLQSEVIDQVVNQLYLEAIQSEGLRPVAAPSITLTKFVPFDELEFTAEVEAVGEVKLPAYTKIKVSRPPVTVAAKDVNEVLENLRQRAAQKSEVKRGAKKGDEVTIDFSGVDAASGEPIQGADGKDYPLVLGSDSFIPGFEDELVGVKPSETKVFTLTFPKDYGVAALQSKKVSFTVTVHKVNALTLPAADDALAQSLGPFKNLAELKTDIKKQLVAEKERDANQLYINELLKKIAEKTDVAIPDSLVEEEIDRMEVEEKQNLAYRGQTWEEHLKEEGITYEAHRGRQRDVAQQRVKSGLILGQIANQAGITVTPEELEMRLQLLKAQYQDPAMQAELDKPDNRRDLHSRLMTEKTFGHLLKLAPTVK